MYEHQWSMICQESKRFLNFFQSALKWTLGQLLAVLIVEDLLIDECLDQSTYPCNAIKIANVSNID